MHVCTHVLPNVCVHALSFGRFDTRMNIHMRMLMHNTHQRTAKTAVVVGAANSSLFSPY